MKTIKRSLIAAAAALLILPATSALAQATAKIHGHVQNAAGEPLVQGDVKLTKDKTSPEKDMKMVYSFPLGKDGNYTGDGIAPGDYFAYVIVADKHVDRMELSVKAGDDKTLNFDMTRAEYVKNMTPEEKAAIEEYKKKNAAVSADNKVIANLNTTLKEVRADLDAAKTTGADVSKDLDMMKAANDARKGEPLILIEYGNTLQAQGDHLAKEDRDAKKSPSSDDAVVKMYSDAADIYKQAADASAAAKKPDPVAAAVAYNQMGNAFAKAGKVADASGAFENAAKLQPASAGMYYGNEAAILFNSNKSDDALAAADKAIAADPTRADPYFIKGQVLVQRATVDPKTQLPVAPPGCLEAYQKYLELAPDGKNAATVKEVLTGFGQKIDTKYSAGPTKKR